MNVIPAMAEPEASSARAVRSAGGALDAGPALQPPPDAKTVATMQARAALVGFQLAALPDGTFVAARWDRHVELLDAAAVEGFLRRVGAPTA